MRIVIDIMIGLMLVGVVAGGFYLYNHREQDKRDIEVVRQALQQLQQQATYHQTMQSAMADRDVMLVHLHAEWFGEDVPTNVLVDVDQPWIDLAPPGDLGEHPPDPVVYSSDQAGFWYNPTTGVFRARVRPASSEAQTLTLYNDVNGTALPGFEQIPDPARQPLAHHRGQTPAQQYATMANKTWSETREEEELATDLLEAEIEAALQAQDDGLSEADRPVNEPTFDSSQTPQNVHVSPDESAAPAKEPSKRPTLKGLGSE